MRRKSINFDSNPCCLLILSALRFVNFLNEKVSMMLLQESDKVNETSRSGANVEIRMNCMMNPESEH